MSDAVDDLIDAVIGARLCCAARGPAWCWKMLDDLYEQELETRAHLTEMRTEEYTNVGEVVAELERALRK